MPERLTNQIYVPHEKSVFVLDAVPVTIELSGTGNTGAVILNNKLLRPDRSLKVCNHSPDGFSWGYRGSGPAQLALAVCLEYLPELVAGSVYQDFKERIIALISCGEDFTVTIPFYWAVTSALFCQEMDVPAFDLVSVGELFAQGSIPFYEKGEKYMAFKWVAVKIAKDEWTIYYGPIKNPANLIRQTGQKLSKMLEKLLFDNLSLNITRETGKMYK